jgi:hypothetical protein
MIAAEGYYDTRQELYFSINPAVYFVSSRAVEIQIVGSNQVYEGTAVVGEARWAMQQRSSDSEPREAAHGT